MHIKQNRKAQYALTTAFVKTGKLKVKKQSLKLVSRIL